MDIIREFALPADREAAVRSQVEQFISSNDGKRIALVTSGGTSVPLEQNTVRFIDNFSAGTRGAASTEYLLRQGYAVVLLHRHSSLLPYNRRLRPHNAPWNFIDLLNVDSNGSITVDSSRVPGVADMVEEYRKVKAENRLLLVEFITLHDYLGLLHLCATLLNGCGRRALLYLAAAVSDFYIPNDKLPKHKIQSQDGPLNLTLGLVPKMLQPLVHDIVPNAFVVSFKLETDVDLLTKKSRQSLEHYGHQLVIGNILDKRKTEVTLVTKSAAEEIRLTDEQVEAGAEIEEIIIAKIAVKHETHIKSG
uniref:DNA/pantothenate metabolism flavoprotein C-terminal domain-containing protein n=1 Tax=Plectus sambesii TaxID=2011161 RepID=A0A914W7S2_9BILA